MDSITVVRTGRSIRFVCRRDIGPFVLAAEGGTIREAKERVTAAFLASERMEGPHGFLPKNRRR